MEHEMRVLVVPNTGKDEAISGARELVAWLRDAGHEAVLAMDDAQACGCPEAGVALNALGEVGLVVALGGDGTIIKAVRKIGELDAPVLGVNFGRLGFLSAADGEHMLDAVEAALAGEFRAERRLTLRASVSQGGREVGSYRVLNEVFVGRLGASRVADLSVSVSGAKIADFSADGIIVATPTGSTAYSLSAGGPIVAPDVRALVVVPVAPHTLADRAVIVGPGEEVEITCPAGRAADVCVTVDGQEVPCRMTLDAVRVRAAQSDVTLVRLDGRGFYDVVADEFFRG